ncbi:hypothetical protein [Pantoea sp. KPR_PJ]|uniref:hypothetical protein n=1 Tax=Pantoea sp. KPR_PJ TaxID=2738375 RepID=UPI00352800F0
MTTLKPLLAMNPCRMRQRRKSVFDYFDKGHQPARLSRRTGCSGSRASTRHLTGFDPGERCPDRYTTDPAVDNDTGQHGAPVLRILLCDQGGGGSVQTARTLPQRTLAQPVPLWRHLSDGINRLQPGPLNVLTPSSSQEPSP